MNAATFARTVSATSTAAGKTAGGLPVGRAGDSGDGGDSDIRIPLLLSLTLSKPCKAGGSALR